MIRMFHMIHTLPNTPWHLNWHFCTITHLPWSSSDYSIIELLNYWIAPYAPCDPYTPCSPYAPKHTNNTLIIHPLSPTSLEALPIIRLSDYPIIGLSNLCSQPPLINTKVIILFSTTKRLVWGPAPVPHQFHTSSTKQNVVRYCWLKSYQALPKNTNSKISNR